MGKPAVSIELLDGDRLELERLLPGYKTWANLARRARIVFLAARGMQNKVIAQEVGCDQMTIAKWRKRFVDLTRNQIKRGVHRSTIELANAITHYIDVVNKNPKPFRWTKSADEIRASVKRFCLATQLIANSSGSGHSWNAGV